MTSLVTLFLVEVGHFECGQVGDEGSGVVGGGLGVDGHCTQHKVQALHVKEVVSASELLTTLYIGRRA